MARSFNVTGKCLPEKHYMVDPFERMSFDYIQKLIADGHYFVIHAPRQSGKTTFLYTLQEYLNKEGKYTCLAFSCESAEPLDKNIEEVEERLVDEIYESAQRTLSF